MQMQRMYAYYFLLIHVYNNMNSPMKTYCILYYYYVSQYWPLTLFTAKKAQKKMLKMEHFLFCFFFSLFFFFLNHSVNTKVIIRHLMMTNDLLSSPSIQMLGCIQHIYCAHDIVQNCLVVFIMGSLT